MSDLRLSFYGSKADLDDLRRVLTQAGFQEIPDDSVRACDASDGAIITLSMIFLIHAIPEASKCIQTWMIERSKRMVKRDGSRYTIRGNFTAQEFSDIVETCDRLTIEDDNNHET